MPDGQLLEFSGLTKRFGAIEAVSGFTARIEPGLVTGFLGPNGAGKTTTLRTLLGLIRADAGTATIGGVAYAKLTHPLQSVGAVLEASSFHPGRSGANHLKVYAQAAGLPLTRVDDALGMVGLADAAGRKVGGYSLGMRQRLGLAYALLGDPGVLVLDEPANGLDPEGIKWLRGLLRKLAREGRTVLVSSHLLAEVQQTVDALLIIARGKLVFQGRLEELTDPSEYATTADAPDRAALASALRTAEVPFEVLRSGLTVRGMEPSTVGALAASAGVALSLLQRRGPALEEVFLELVNGVRVHPSAYGRVLLPIEAPVAAGAAASGANEAEVDGVKGSGADAEAAAAETNEAASDDAIAESGAAVSSDAMTDADAAAPEPSAEDDPTDTDLAEAAPADTDPTGAAPADTDPTEAAPGGSDSTGAAPADTDPTEAAPGGSDSTASDPAATHLTAGDPAATHLAVSDPAATSLTAGDPAATHLTASDPAATNLTAGDPIPTEGAHETASPDSEAHPDTHVPAGDAPDAVPQASTDDAAGTDAGSTEPVAATASPVTSTATYAVSSTASFAVARTGVIDIVPPTADSDDAADETDAAAPEIDDAIDPDRPWQEHVKTEADLEADRFFAAFDKSVPSDEDAPVEAESEPEPEAESGSEPGFDHATAHSDPHSHPEHETHDETHAALVNAPPESPGEDPHPETSEFGSLADLYPEWAEPADAEPADTDPEPDHEGGEQR